MVFEQLWGGFSRWVVYYFGVQVNPLILIISTIVLFIFLMIPMMIVLSRLTEANLAFSALISFAIVIISWYTKTILWITGVFEVMSYVMIGAITFFLFVLFAFVAYKSLSIGARFGYTMAKGMYVLSKKLRKKVKEWREKVRGARSLEELQNMVEEVQQEITSTGMEVSPDVQKSLNQAKEAAQQGNKKEVERHISEAFGKLYKGIMGVVRRQVKRIRDVQKNLRMGLYSIETAVRILNRSANVLITLYERAELREEEKELKKFIETVNSVQRMVGDEKTKREVLIEIIDYFLERKKRKWKYKKLAEIYYKRIKK